MSSEVQLRTGESPADREPDGDDLVVVPVRHPLRWVAVAVLAVLLAMLVHSLVVNPAWRWSYVRGYFTDAQIMNGIVVTLELTGLAAPFGRTDAPEGLAASLAAMPLALWLVLPALPFLAAAIGWLTAHGTVRRWLRRLP